MINVGHNESLIADAGEREGGEPLDERDETTPGWDEQEEDAGQGAHHREGVGNHWWLSSPYYKSSSLTIMIIISGKYSSLTGLATMDFSSETANSAHSSSSSQVVLLLFK